MTSSPRPLRSLNKPRKITVTADSEARPLTVVLNGRRLSITAYNEVWRIEDEWWRPKPIARIYWRLSLQDGRVVDIYRDLSTGEWSRQSYG
jgi:hypothetical protein